MSQPLASIGLHTKLVQLRKALQGSAIKTGTNKEQGYGFVEVVELGKKFVAQATELGLSVVPVRQELVDMRATPSGRQTVASVRSAWQITDADTGEAIVVESMGAGADQTDKFIPKALSNSLKYFILGLLQTAGDDPERDEDTDRLEKAGAQAEGDDPRAATEAQLKLIRARAREKDYGKEQLQAIVFSTTGKRSLKDLTKGEVDKVIDGIRDFSPDVNPDVPSNMSEPDSEAGGN